MTTVERKIKELTTYLAENPDDYKAVVRLYKLRSTRIEEVRRAKALEELALIEEYRRKLDGK